VIAAVEVDLAAKRALAMGDELDDHAFRAAIDEAGYDVA
jgi:copper chaperone CopZ